MLHMPSKVSFDFANVFKYFLKSIELCFNTTIQMTQLRGVSRILGTLISIVFMFSTTVLLWRQGCEITPFTLTLTIQWHVMFSGDCCLWVSTVAVRNCRTTLIISDRESCCWWIYSHDLMSTTQVSGVALVTHKLRTQV